MKSVYAITFLGCLFILTFVLGLTTELLAAPLSPDSKEFQRPPTTVSTANTDANVEDMVFTSETDGWQVGTNGAIWRYQSDVWVSVTSPVTESLVAIDYTSVNDVWAVGENGAIVHWDGATWEVVETPTTNDLKAIDMRTPTDGWAVGGGRTNGAISSVILRWNGSAWVSIASPTTREYYVDVAMISETDGWLAAFSELYRWDGTAWTLNSRTDIPRKMELLSATHGWGSTYAGRILKWDGTQWSEASTPLSEGSSTFGSRTQIHDFAVLSETEAWAVGMLGVILRWDGTSWALMPHMTANTLEVVAARTSSDVRIQNATTGSAQWDGSSWSGSFPAEPSPPSGYNYSQIEGPSTTSLWAIGESLASSGFGTSLVAWTNLYRFVNEQWELQYYPNPNIDLADLTFISETEGYAVGGTLVSGFFEGYVLRWDGSQWSDPIRILPEATNVYPIAVGLFRDDVGIVIARIEDSDNSYGCSACVVLAHWDGATWQIIAERNSTSSLGKIDVVSAENIWIFELNMPIRWDGTQFITTTDSPNGLESVSFTSATEGWGSVGYGIYRYANGVWQYSHSLDHDCNAPSYPESDISFVSSSLGWASTYCSSGQTNPYIHRWDGQTSTRFESPTSGKINDVYALPTGVWLGTGQGLAQFALGPNVYVPLVFR